MSSFRMQRLVLVAGFWGVLQTQPLAAEEDNEQLLLLPEVSYVAGLGSTTDAEQVGALIDGNVGTIAHFATSADMPADLIFELGATVAPRGMTIHLSPVSAANHPGFVDILVSDTSPTSGFRSLKSEALTGLETKVEWDFAPASARWIMLRFYPRKGVLDIEVADISVIGNRGPPETRYAFGETPAGAFDVLRGLSELEPSAFEPDATEAALFERARAGSFSQEEFETAALLASGVRDPTALSMYMGRIDELEAQARFDLDLESPPAVLGADLLEWMHQNVLQAGYVASQTDLSVLLDQSSFNCVSSAVLYAVLGRRLGLDVRGIEVPDHAFAIVYDGATHFDVETTTAQGFNPARDHIAEFEALTGFVYIPEAHRDKRREIGAGGMAALIYYNHGVQALKDGRYLDALLANFRALSLDSEFSTAATNVLAALGRWSADLAKAGRWEEAERVAAAGTDLAPDDAGLAAARLAVWQGWAVSLADAGKSDEAVALLESAKREMPDADLDGVQAWIFIRPSEELAARGAWEEAIAAAEPGRSVLQGAARDSLEDWRLGLFLRWISEAVEHLDFQTAEKALERGLRDYPSSDKLERMVRFVAQESAESAPDFSTALAVLGNLRERFPGNTGVSDAVKTHVANEILQAGPAMQMTEALALVESAKGLMPMEQAVDLGAMVFETYGHRLVDAGDWSAAAAIYAEGLMTFPDEYVLRTNALYVAQEWRSAAFAKGGIAALDEVNKSLAGMFPSFDQTDGEDAIRRKIADLIQGGDFGGALRVLDEGQLVLVPDSVAELGALIVDRQAQGLMKLGNWQRAAEVYADGLARFPNSWNLQNNAVYVAQEWTLSADVQGGATAVMEIASKLRKMFPGNEDIAAIGVETLKRSIAARIEAKEYDAAKAIIAAARPALTSQESRDLVLLLYSVWAGERINAKDWRGASEVLSEALRAAPDENDLQRNAAYVVQEWTAEGLSAEGAAGFVATAGDARRAFPDLPNLEEILVGVLGRGLERTLDEGHAEDALALLKNCSGSFSAEAEVELMENVYDRWARAAADANDLVEAVRIYDLGLADIPESTLLAQNRAHFVSKLE